MHLVWFLVVWDYLLLHRIDFYWLVTRRSCLSVCDIYWWNLLQIDRLPRMRHRRPQFLSSPWESMQRRCETSGRTLICLSEWSLLQKIRSKRDLWDTKSDKITANKYGLRVVSTNRCDNSFKSTLNYWQERFKILNKIFEKSWQDLEL